MGSGLVGFTTHGVNQGHEGAELRKARCVEDFLHFGVVLADEFEFVEKGEAGDRETLETDFVLDGV
jgi:hypothetical protein